MCPKRKSVLIAGTGRFTPSHARYDVLEKIEVGVKEAHDAGFDITHLHVNPGDPERSVDIVREALKSNDYDAFMIGYGLRGKKENKVVFENLVNCAMEIKGGKVGGMKLLFATAADRMLEALKRL